MERHERFRSKTLVFKCEQDIDRMPNVDGGKYCQLCAKTLIDFRQKTYKEFIEITKDKTDYCGIYHPEQVEDIYPIELNFRKPRLFIATIASFFGVTLTSAFAQPRPEVKTEQTTNDTLSIEPSEKTTEQTQASEKYPDNCTPKESHDKIDNNKRVIYLSKSFPFIHRKPKRRYTRGF